LSALMESQRLDESWCVVVVVTPENIEGLRSTLTSVQANSLGTAISVLATDIRSVREALSDCIFPVEYTLPSTMDSQTQWTTICAHHLFATRRSIFVLAGTVVPQHWDARLVAAAQRAGDVAGVAPLCARHPILSAFFDAAHKPGLAVDEIDQWLNDYVEGIEFTVPVMLGSCILLQGDFWRDQCRGVSTDRLLLAALRNVGKSLIATDRVYVDDSNTHYDNDVSFLPRAYQTAYVTQHPLQNTRHALTELSKRREKPVTRIRCLPVQLHIGHSWGGGLGRWMEDFIAADNGHNHLVLRSVGDLNAFGQTIGLYRSMDMGFPVRTWTLCEPVTSISLGSYEYRRIIEELISEYSVESLMISSLIGHSLDLLRTPLPTTMVLHDFFPFCPALYATFGSPCHSCTGGELRACSRDNPLHSFFNVEDDDFWLAARLPFVDLLMPETVTLVAPSHSVVERYRRLEPRLQEKQINIVPHGLSEQLAKSLASTLPSPFEESSGRLRVVVLGRLTVEKGANILADILADVAGFADVFLFGVGTSGTQFDSMTGVTVVASYRKDELGELLRKTQPDIGLLLSTVPETFSYTLSELWAAGIPVLATRLGAFIDRIEEGDNGWLVEPDPAAVLAQLRLLNGQRELLLQAKDRLLQRPVRTADSMVDAYAALETRSEWIPLDRYTLARRSYRNPYTQGGSGELGQALHVNHQLPYRKVLADFLDYTGRKADQSPRLPVWLRAGISRLLRHLAVRCACK
jgi:glycosyltransferase involved in cell wall biosynthesis